ncbi:hypothetical protein I6J18_22690 [Peribacillus psychrosaccharolyticus]|uniref:Uncharacterized protein n=1 Tax=Peribacillus psychrosaccharolyticus TaxID=1407 RepID=A0A974S0B6_PERPY|nr:hypothetical protein [Peribacillus psychrosaccharolyticus]MEC2056517.1 hypothetical protein [Peribacillus psychrosaccharolyticus]MED3745649.1 hypothetical protein [Peribacillus psychrosaccharolyticus]QQT00339.1 hypothetical protein I6J18_22690 [Peribacillus psychrosaccharolyticus]
MKKLKKRQIIIILSVLVGGFILFSVYDYFNTQKKEEQYQAFMEESSELTDGYDIISFGFRPDKKTINVYVPLEEKSRNEIVTSFERISQKYGMKDFEVKVKAIKKGDPIEN